MATLSNLLLDKEILLESGTNELEILVFDVADYTFGINVAKVREVLPTAEITSLPQAHQSIRGVFKLRNQVIPCVSLLDHLGIQSTRENAESTMILTDLNQQQTAFLVDQVERIHRLSWEHILAVPGLSALSHTPVTALARCDNRLIVMLDFEMILDDVTEQFFRTSEVENPLGLPREEIRILLAEDSPTVRAAVEETLRASGYAQLTSFENGALAWKWMEDRLRETGKVEEVGDLLIADVEMPQVDGLHLTKRVKQHPELQRIPVLLYSSIITPDNRKKGNAVGADAQVSKPELARVVEIADELISNARRQRSADCLRQIAETSSMERSQPEVVAQHEPKPPVAPPLPSSLQPLCAPEPSLVSASDAASAAAIEAIEAELREDYGNARPSCEIKNVKLWKSFQRELVGRIEQLRLGLSEIRPGGCSDETMHQLARTLHTIKSASMVVPVEPITRCTHLAESMLESARRDPQCWPHEAMQRYTDWLTGLTSPVGEVPSTLGQGPELEIEMRRWLAQHAAEPHASAGRV